jgi:predicted TPR repeat methyltransferase
VTAADGQRLFAQGVALHKQGRLAEAASAYAQACAADPASVAAQFNHAVALQALGRDGDAEPAYLRALALKPDLVQALNNLANLYIAANRLEEARVLLHRALAAAPGFAPTRNNLGNILLRKGEVDAAIERFTQAVDCDGQCIPARINLGKALLSLGRTADALAHLEAALAHHPADDTLRFLRDTATDAQPSRPPDGFVVSLFDDMAGDFDRHLVDELGYRIPDRIAEVATPWLETRPRPRRIVDLGCGTGLVGERLRGHFEELAGVDLSPRMVARAQSRGVYTSLDTGELLAFLSARPPASADVVAAADVFIYVGALEAVFAQVARIAAPGARFVFSVEVGEESDSFRLHAASRYTHGDGYVRTLAAAHGFDIVHDSAETIRTERGQPVAGRLYVLELPGRRSS